MSLPDVNPTIPPAPPDDDHDNDNDSIFSDDDIYRGSAPPSLRQSSISLSSSSSSSSSSGSFLGVRLGAIANVLEHAISHWAGGGSSSSSSSSSKSSVVTLTKSQMARKRRRRPSMGNLHSDQSERDIAARISVIKAREESRQVPRQFCLYLPPVYRSYVSADGPQDSLNDNQKVTLSSSLSFVLGQLDTVLKKASKAKRRAARSPSPGPPPPLPHHDFMMPDSIKVPSRAASFNDLQAEGRSRSRKGKQRDGAPAPRIALDPAAPKTWYLDVASPTGADMQAIGKLLHLHPLTLEDILQQDPREKVEVFSKLGYYFISFRAIASKAVRGGLQARLNKKSDESEDNSDAGIIGEANLYLVVFNEGICSFHFTDIGEHTDRVRNRLFMLEGVRSLSAAWIAHGLLDSVVDSFFPFLEEIDEEVAAIEDLVFSYGEKTTNSQETLGNSSEEKVDSPPLPTNDVSEKDSSLLTFSEKLPLEKGSLKKTRFAVGRTPLPLLFRRLRRFVLSKTHPQKSEEQGTPSPTLLTLRRMAKARRLVTSLTRLLAVKSDVVLQIRKRLLIANMGSHDKSNEASDIAIYMGDVHDHILTLQHSLAHYERMLSQSHPLYLSQLRTTAELTKQGTDKALIMLTVVSIGVLCVQPITGILSTNVTVPANASTVDDPYNVFGIVIALVFITLLVYLRYARLWWNQAKRRRNVAL